MASVVILGIPCEEFSHDGRDAVFAALKKNVNMVVHEDPRIDGAFPLNNVLPEAIEKASLVLVIIEYVGLVYSPHHDVVQCSGYIQSRLAWHGMILLRRAWLVNINVR